MTDHNPGASVPVEPTPEADPSTACFCDDGCFYCRPPVATAAGDLTPGGRPWPQPGDKVLWDGLGPEPHEVWAVSPTGYAWLADDSDGYVVCTDHLRPVEPPSPATQRIPWWEAVGRDLAGQVGRRRVTAVSFDADDGRAWCRTVDGGDLLDERGRWANDDGTVEVLCDPEAAS